MKLRTLGDIDFCKCKDGFITSIGTLTLVDDNEDSIKELLQQEAIKHIKALNNDMKIADYRLDNWKLLIHDSLSKIDWIEHFFNLKKSDLK